MPRPAPRQKAWAAMRHLKVFTLADIEDITEASYSTCYNYCLALEFSEHLVRLEKGGRQGYGRLRLLKDTGPVAPFIQEVFIDDQPTRIVVDPNLPNQLAQHRQRMWQVMRLKSVFTTADLMMFTNCERTIVLRYIRLLTDGEYLRLVGKRRSNLSGYSGGYAKVLRLIRNTGPVAPVPQSGQIFDPNLFSAKKFFEELQAKLH